MKTADITDKTVCQAYATARHMDVFADAVLAEQFPDCPEKVIYRAMERAHRRDLIQYGVSLRAGWLTEAGLALIAAD